MTQSDIGIVELKTCPFCGNCDTLIAGESGLYVKCRACDARAGGERTTHGARAAWNTRDPIIMEMVEALEAYVHAWDDIDRPFQPQMPRLYAQAKATLAKVSGK